MDDLPTSPQPGTKSNGEKDELNRLNLAAASLTNELSQCQVAVDNLQARLSDARAAIQKQHEVLKALEARRDEFWKKLNTAVKNRKDLVYKYTDMIHQIQKKHSPGHG